MTALRAECMKKQNTLLTIGTNPVQLLKPIPASVTGLALSAAAYSESDGYPVPSLVLHSTVGASVLLNSAKENDGHWGCLTTDEDAVSGLVKTLRADPAKADVHLDSIARLLGYEPNDFRQTPAYAFTVVPSVNAGVVLHALEDVAEVYDRVGAYLTPNLQDAKDSAHKTGGTVIKVRLDYATCRAVVVDVVE